MKNKLAFGAEPSKRRYRLRLARYQGVVDAVQAYRHDAGTTAASEPLSLLDVGAGQGRTLQYLKAAGLDEGISFHGIDNAPKRQQQLFEAERWHYQLADVEQGLPYTEARFDIVVCEQVLEHLHDPGFVLREIARVLRPEGIAILGVPSFAPFIAPMRRHVVPALDRLTGRCRDHAQVFTKGSFVDMIQAGSELEVEDVRGFRFISGGVMEPLEDFHWWYQLNRRLATQWSSFATEIQVVARRVAILRTEDDEPEPAWLRRGLDRGGRLAEPVGAGAGSGSPGPGRRSPINLNLADSAIGQHVLSTAARRTLLGVAATTLLMILLAFTLGDQGRLLFADQSGLLEKASVFLWLGLAVGLIVLLRPVTWSVGAMAGTCLAAAAIEGNWHESFTGYSVWQLESYLTNSSYSVADRLLVGTFAKTSLLCAAVTGWAIYRRIRERGRWAADWVQLLAIFFMVMGVAEGLDRLPIMLQQSFGIRLLPATHNLLQASGEGLELLLPVLLLAAALLFARAGKPRTSVG